MITIFTKKNCFMFNMTDYSQELKLCAEVAKRLKDFKEKGIVKSFKITIKDPQYFKPRIIKFSVDNVTDVKWEERFHNFDLEKRIDYLIRRSGER